jgi:protein gp37
MRLKGRGGYPEDNPFFPTLHEDRFRQPLEIKKGSMIFTCSMGDIFDSHVEGAWREKVYNVISKSQRHIYQILTKQCIVEPGNGGFHNNIWLGITIDGSSSYWKKPLASLKSSSANVKFISFEPIIGTNIPSNLEGIDWIIIGAQTGNGSRPPDMKIVMKIIKMAERNTIPIFIKPNIRHYFDKGNGEKYRNLEEFPR